MARRTGPTPRPGYTMVELLVVILIISVLAALTTAAVVRVIGSGDKARAASEIGQIDLAMTNFYKDHKLYPPSYMTETATDGQQYVRRFVIPVNTAQPEFQVLKRMFPRWPATTAADGVTLQPALEGAGTPLDANQVMVYFLGGPRALLGPTFPGYVTGTATYGWQKTQPFAPGSGANTRIDPYYDFPEARLMPEGGTHDGRFRDPWGTPYAYFSSSGNNYDARFIFPWYTGSPPQTRSFTSVGNAEVAVVPYTPPPDGTFSDPTHLVHPFQSGGRWVNEGKVQIVSAGPDLGFGAGSFPQASGPPRAWVPGQAEYISGGTGNVGYDDIANFNAGSALGETGR